MGRVWEELGEATVEQDAHALVPLLERFDACFASFEQEYLSFLIRAEDACKAIVKKAAGDAHAVRHGAPEAETRFVATLQELNGLANTKGKGRRDLGMDILETARAHNGGALSQLCARVISSFEAAVAYFEAVGTTVDGLDRIDPQLHLNHSLAAVLAEWEEAWEAAQLYGCQPTIYQAMARSRGRPRAVWRAH